MRICLLNPPGTRTWFRDGYCSSSSKSGYCWHPLDLLVQSGILSSYGHDLLFIDAIAEELSATQCIQRIEAFSPELVLALAGDASWPEDVRFFRWLHARGLIPQLILSGDTPRFEPTRCFKEMPQVSAILTDFSSHAVQAFIDGQSNPAGLSVNGKTPKALPSRQWSSAPARHDLLKKSAYRLPFHSGAAFASVLASYGCPFSCTFCNTGQLPYKLRPIEESIAEMQLVQQLGYSYMYLRDATANGHRDSFLTLCQEMAHARINLQWNTFCTFKPFDAELANAMAKAGCTVVQMGFETASEAKRAETGKPFDNESARAAVRYAHEAGIKVCGHFVLGLPGQDEEDVVQSGEFARQLDLDYASFNLAAARPGTQLREEADRLGLSGGDASEGGFVAGLADVTPERLKALRRQAIMRFYLRTRPLKAVVGDLSTKDGWRNLGRTAQALARVF